MAFGKRFKALKEHKYKAKKCIYNDIEYDSQKEANRARELDLLLKSGKICNLERQVRYKWIETHSVNDFTTEQIQFKRAWIADFVYYDKETQSVVVEDVKGFFTDEFKKKRKIVEKIFGFKITII